MNKISIIGILVLFTIALILNGCTDGTVGEAKRQPIVTVCNDGVDNDGDGNKDLADPGCADKRDTSELNPAIECDDGRDNDRDGRIDSRDGGCTGAEDTDESNCGDGVCEGGETPENCQDDCGPVDSCTDSDGGYVLDVKGTVKGYVKGRSYSYTDECMQASSLTEYYCTGNAFDSVVYKCPGSCKNGVCA